MSYLGFLGLTWPLVKAKASYKVVGRDMETMSRRAVWGCRTSLNGFSGRRGVLPKTNLALSGKAAGAVGVSVELKKGGAIWGCWAGFTSVSGQSAEDTGVLI